MLLNLLLGALQVVVYNHCLLVVGGGLLADLHTDVVRLSEVLHDFDSLAAGGVPLQLEGRAGREVVGIAAVDELKLRHHLPALYFNRGWPEHFCEVG